MNFGPEGGRDGRFYRTASGEWIPDGGASQFKGYDENGLLRSLNGRLTGAHEVLCSAAEIACKGEQDFYFGTRWWYMIPIHTNICQGMRIHLETLVKKGMERTISFPVYLDREEHFQFLPEPRSEVCRNQQCERRRALFYEEQSIFGKRAWQRSALVSPTTTLDRDVVPIGNDIESVVNSRADVETRHEEEEEESLEAEIPSRNEPEESHE